MVVGYFITLTCSLVIFARRDIKKGEECCISYKGLPVS